LISEGRKNIVDEKLDAGEVLNAAEFVFQSRFDGTTTFMAEDHEERSMKMSAGVMETGHDFGGNDVTGDADDEEFAQIGIEDQLGRDPRVAAAENRGVGVLALARAASVSLQTVGKRALPSTSLRRAF
jgi:hypothetical protein